MTLDEALQYADLCDEALTHHKPIFDGPVTVISVLAAEVRRLRASSEPLTDEQIFAIRDAYAPQLKWGVIDFARAIEKMLGGES